MTLLLKTATAPKLRGSLSPARQYFVWAALLGLHLAWVGPCVADDAATIREFLLQGIAQRSESLKSATFTAHGRKTVPVSQPGEDVPAGEIIIRGAIDGARLRFDYGEPAFVAAPAKIADRIQENQRISREEAERLSKEAVDTFKEGDKKEITIARIETYYIRTPEKIAYWFNGHPTVFLVAPNSEVGPHIRRFDVNALGLYGWLEFQKGIGVSELLAGYRAIKNVDVQELSRGVWRLSFAFDGTLTSSRWEIDVDSQAGFTPVQTKLTELNKKTNESQVKQSSQTSWKNVNGAWVPEKFRIQNGSEDGKEGTKREVVVEFEFDFEHVNEAIEESQFSYKSFPAPDLAAVIDNSAAKPVVVRSPYENLPPRERRQTITPSRQVGIIVAANIAVLLTVGVLVYLKRRRGGRSKQPH